MEDRLKLLFKLICLRELEKFQGRVDLYKKAFKRTAQVKVGGGADGRLSRVASPTCRTRNRIEQIVLKSYIKNNVEKVLKLIMKQIAAVFDYFF